jgi:integrase
MFRMGYEQRPRLVPDIPQFPTKLPETARTGFVDDAAFQRVLAAISQPGLRALVLVAYRLGFRKSELQNLLVLQVAGSWIQLFAGATKNGKARRVAMPDDVRAAVELCLNGKDPDAYVFTWPGGRRILDFRAAWEKATAAAGVPDLLFHDLRRSAARRMVRAGLPVATAMKITGHLTRTVFDTYDVSGDNNLLEAARKL